MTNTAERDWTEIEKQIAWESQHRDDLKDDCASVYVVGDDDELVPIDDISKMAQFPYGISSRDRVPISKNVPGSHQNPNELGDFSFGTDASAQYVTPPYDPECLKEYLKYDPVNYRATKVKVTDAVLRDYELVPTVPIMSDADGELATDPESIPKEQYAEIEKTIRNFIKTCGDVIDFEGVLERAAMDYETIGWAAIEVVRSPDMLVRKIAHIPAERVRVQKGWKYFVEILTDLGTNVRYYLPYGRKVKSVSRSVDGYTEYYDPELDGPLEVGNKNIALNLVDFRTGEGTDSFENSANEILWIPKHHCATVYYGLPDSIPCLGDILANVNIRQYLIDFFEHNTIPRYAIIIEGGDFSPEVKRMLQEYFREHIKGQAHKTLILPVKGVAGQVKIRFEKLDADTQEGSFQETRKNNNQQIMTAHGVSPAIIGIAEAANLGSGKGLSQAENYKDRIITPMQRLWGRQISKLFSLGLGITELELRFTPLDIRDLEAESKYLQVFTELGALTINEVRSRLGKRPIEGGDRPFILLPGGIQFINELDQSLSSAEERLLRQFGDQPGVVDRILGGNSSGKTTDKPNDKPPGKTKRDPTRAPKQPRNSARAKK